MSCVSVCVKPCYTDTIPCSSAERSAFICWPSWLFGSTEAACASAPVHVCRSCQPHQEHQDRCDCRTHLLRLSQHRWYLPPPLHPFLPPSFLCLVASSLSIHATQPSSVEANHFPLLCRQSLILKTNSFYRLLWVEENCFAAVPFTRFLLLLFLFSSLLPYPSPATFHHGAAWSIICFAICLIWQFSWGVSKLRALVPPSFFFFFKREITKLIWMSPAQALGDRHWRVLIWTRNRLLEWASGGRHIPRPHRLYSGQTLETNPLKSGFFPCPFPIFPHYLSQCH